MPNAVADSGLRNFQPPGEARLRSLLDLMTRARVLVIGDFCLDAYWFVDSSRSEKSLETGLPTNPVREQRYSLGGAGNVAHNLAAAGCRHIQVIGVTGADPWGREMARQLHELGIGTGDLLVQERDWATLAYDKPHFDGRETSRFDFGNFNELAPETAADLLARCRSRISEADVIIVNQQVRQGMHTQDFRAGLGALFREHPDRTFIVDSRHFSDAYAGACLKINEREAVFMCGLARTREEHVPHRAVLQAARDLFARMGRPVFVTCGRRGMVVVDPSGSWNLPGVAITGPVDSVGAGDSALAGIGLALAAGCDAPEAGYVGNLFAAVTIQKLNQTGTASPEEILAVSRLG